MTCCEVPARTKSNVTAYWRFPPNTQHNKIGTILIDFDDFKLVSWTEFDRKMFTDNVEIVFLHM